MQSHASTKLYVDVVYAYSFASSSLTEFEHTRLVTTHTTMDSTEFPSNRKLDKTFTESFIPGSEALPSSIVTVM